jgi:phospholipid/cholesterol/gamma-HCH transport system substrate-binding protein
MSTVKSRRPIVVGVFIFLGLVILIVAVFTLGGQQKTFVRSKPIRAVFDDIQGLKIGNNVWLSGVKIGTVKRINFTPESRVEVIMNIEKAAWDLVRKDSKVQIGSEGLIGNKIVVISEGTHASPEAEPNDFLRVKTTTSTEDMLETLQKNNKNLLTITANFKDISDRIAAGQGSFGKLLSNENIANDLESTIVNFKRTSIETRRALASIRAFAAQLNTQGTLVNDLVSDTIIFNNLRGSITQLRETAYTAQQFSDNLKSISDSLKIVSARLNEKNSPLGVLLTNEQVADDLKSTISNLQSGSVKLDENLEALQHNFLFRGYFRKKARQQADTTKR